MIAALLVTMSICLGQESQPARSDSGDLSAIESAVADLSARMAALSPDRPEAYYLLGEEVADVAVEESERALARRLFLIAYTSWRASGDQRRAASACLALTTTVTSERDKAWLRAVARSVDPRIEPAQWDSASWAEIDPAVAAQAAVALGSVRSGDGISARQILADPRVVRVLSRYSSLLQSAGGLTRVVRDANIWPCPDCRNKRTVRSRSSSEPAEIICGYCRGDPGPRLTDEEIIAHLRVEALLLLGDQDIWSAQLEVDAGAPLRDPDPDAVARAFGIDAAQSLFRDGEWRWPPGKEPPPSAPAEDSTPEPETPAGGTESTVGEG